MFYKRTDVGLYVRCELRNLAKALKSVRERYGDEAQIQPNAIGNLAILTPKGESLDRTPSPNGIGLFYAGYIDLAVGDLVWETDDTSVNCPWSDKSGSPTYVNGGRSLDLDAITDHVVGKLSRAWDRSAAFQ